MSDAEQKKDDVRSALLTINGSKALKEHLVPDDGGQGGASAEQQSGRRDVAGTGDKRRISEFLRQKIVDELAMRPAVDFPTLARELAGVVTVPGLRGALRILRAEGAAVVWHEGGFGGRAWYMGEVWVDPIREVLDHDGGCELAIAWYRAFSWWPAPDECKSLAGLLASAGFSITPAMSRPTVIAEGASWSGQFIEIAPAGAQEVAG